MKYVWLFLLLCVAAVAQASTIPDKTRYVSLHNPEWFGAKGDSSIDCTPAFRRAVAAISQTQGGGVEWPNGVFRLSDSVGIRMSQPDSAATIPAFTMLGHGPGTKLIMLGPGILHLYAATPGNGHGRFLLKDFDIYTDTAGAESFGLWLENLGDGSIENVHVYGLGQLDVGIKLKGCQQLNLDGFSKVVGCDTGFSNRQSTSPVVFANQVNYYGDNVVGASAVTSIGVLIDGAQDGGWWGGHITNCGIGMKCIAGVSYDIQGVHFEDCGTGLYLNTGGDYGVLHNEFYDCGKDLWVVSATYSNVMFNLFNDTLLTSALSASTRIFFNKMASSGRYVDSVPSISPSNDNSFGWNSNSGSGNLPTGVRSIAPGTAGDSTDFSLLSPGQIDILYQVIAGGPAGSIWTRMQAQGADTTHRWANGKAGWMIFNGTDTTAAIYGTTDAGRGIVIETYSGSATGDSLLPRLVISGNNILTSVSVTGDLNSTSSFSLNPYKNAPDVAVAESMLTTQHYVDLTANNVADSVSQYQSPSEPLALPYTKIVQGAGNDSLLINSSQAAFVLHVDSNLEISAGGPFVTLQGFYATPNVILGVDTTQLSDTAWFVVNLHNGVYDTVWLVRDSLGGGGGGETDTLANNGAWNSSTGYSLIFDSLGTKKIIKGLKEGSGITIATEGDSALVITSTGGGLTMAQIRDSLNSSTGMNNEDIINVERLDVDTIGTFTTAAMHVWNDSVIFDKLPYSANNNTDSQFVTKGYADSHGGGGETDTTGIAGVQNGTTGFGMVSDSLGTRKTIRQIKEGSFIAGAYSGDTAVTISVDTTGLVVTRALKADSAGKASNDGAGSSITTTYLPRADVDDSLAPWQYWNAGVWQYDASDGDADPGDKKFRTGDNASGNNPYTADTLYIDSLDIFGKRVDTLISALEKGTLLRAKAYRVRTKRVLYRVEAKPVDASGYWKVLVHAIDTGTAALVTLADTITFEVISDPRFILHDSLGNYLLTSGKAADASGADSADVAHTGSLFLDGTMSPKVAAASDGQVLAVDHTHTPDSSYWVTPSGGGDDTGAYLDANGGTALERPYIDMYGSVGVVDTLAFLTDSTKAMLWTDSTLWIQGKQGTGMGDSSASSGKFRVVINNVEQLDIDKDSIDFNSKKALNIDSADIVNYTDTSVDIADVGWDYEYVYLDHVHGFGRALEDSIYLMMDLQTPNTDTTYLVRDSAGNITANDKDTVNITGTLPYNCTIDSLEIYYAVTSGSGIVDGWLRGPDKSSFTNLTDSIWAAYTTDLTSSTWAVSLNSVNTAATAGYRFSYRYVVNFAADNDRLRIGWVRLRIKRTS